MGEPAVIEIFVKAFFRQKLLMGALFNDGVMVHHENQVGAPDDRKPVDDNKFEPYRGKYRKLGTGCVTIINDHLYFESEEGKAEFINWKVEQQKSESKRKTKKTKKRSSAG